MNIWCRLGWHNWYYGFFSAPVWGRSERRCMDCSKRQHRAYKPLRWVTYKQALKDRDMNGEHEQCNNCKHIWGHEDDACPECGSQNTWEFDIVTEFKALQKQNEAKDNQIAELKGNKIITDTFIAWIWNKWNQPIGTKFAGFHTKKARDEFEAKMEELNKH